MDIISQLCLSTIDEDTDISLIVNSIVYHITIVSNQPAAIQEVLLVEAVTVTLENDIQYVRVVDDIVKHAPSIDLDKPVAYDCLCRRNHGFRIRNGKVVYRAAGQRQ